MVLLIPDRPRPRGKERKGKKNQRFGADRGERQGERGGSSISLVLARGREEKPCPEPVIETKRERNVSFLH